MSRDAGTGPQVNRRPVGPGDTPFLEQVYASTRERELATTGWTDGRKQAFLAHQFRAQDSHYHQHFGDAEWSILLVDDQPVGRLYLDRRPDEFRIVDVALLPDHRGRGVGTTVLREVIDEADGAGVPVTIHVESANPAMSLYHRLGFTVVEERPPYRLLRRAVTGTS